MPEQSLYNRFEPQLAAAQLVLFMLALGVTLTVEDFRRTFRQPKSLITALIGQVLLSPLIAVGISKIFGLSDGIALGLVLIAAMPGGSLAKAFVLLGRGNASLAISMTIVSTLCSIVTVPLVIELFARNCVPESYQIPVLKIISDVAIYMLAPLAGGMYLGSVFPDRKEIMRRRFGRLGLGVVILMVLGAMRSGRVKFFDHGWEVPIAIILFILVCMQVNMLPFRLTRAARGDTLTAGVESSMRNANLALLIQSSLFHDPENPGQTVFARFPELKPVADDVMYALLFYAGSALVIGLPLVFNFLRMARRDDRAAAAAVAAAAAAGSVPATPTTPEESNPVVEQAIAPIQDR